MNNFFEENKFDVLDMMARLFSKESIKIIDRHKYKALLSTASELKKLLQNSQANGEIAVEINEMFNIGSITAEVTDLSITNIPSFFFILSSADIFEIYPLTNGKIRLDITFHNVLKTLK